MGTPPKKNHEIISGRLRKLDVDVNDIEGELSAELAAAAPARTLLERIEDVLLEDGLTPAAGTLTKLEDLIDDEAIVRTAELLRRLVLSMESKPAAAALQRALLGNEFESLRDAAKRVGCSHVAIIKAGKKIRLPRGTTLDGQSRTDRQRAEGRIRARRENHPRADQL